MQVEPVAHARPDLVLRGGRVIDPQTGRDEMTDVVVTARRIVHVGAWEGAAARDVLDVTGLVVAPGFVDLHSHAQTIPSLRLQAADGVTTALELEAGAGDVATAYRQAEDEGRPVNVGYSASWVWSRAAALAGTRPRNGFLPLMAAMADERWRGATCQASLSRLLGRIEDEIGAGALGVGVMVGYAPETGRREFYRVAALAERLGAPAFVHARFKNPDDPHSALEGAAEVVAAAAGTGAHLHLCHLNSTSVRAVDEVSAMVSGARQRGTRVSTEAYPYGAGMTAIGAPFLHPDNLARAQLRPSSIEIATTGERPRDAERLGRLRREAPDALVFVHYLDESAAEDLATIRSAFLLTDAAVASDAIPFTGPDGRLLEADQPLPVGSVSHPRTAGTFTRFLRTMVAETGALTLTEALRRCSLLPAQLLEEICPQMSRKGRVQPGSDADLVVLDLASVTDRSTYDAPHLPSAGVRHVLVGGELVVRDGEVLPALPGRPVRGGTT